MNPAAQQYDGAWGSTPEEVVHIICAHFTEAHNTGVNNDSDRLLEIIEITEKQALQAIQALIAAAAEAARREAYQHASDAIGLRGAKAGVIEIRQALGRGRR